MYIVADFCMHGIKIVAMINFLADLALVLFFNWESALHQELLPVWVLAETQPLILKNGEII